MSDLIRKLESLIQPHLEPDTTILEYNIRRLTAPGEHYGSIMLAVELKIKNSNDEEDILNLVAKKIPDNEWLQMMFNVQESFPKEMRFYDTVIPTLIDFQIEQGMVELMDFFPKYYGGRINLNPNSNKVDDDAVMLLENLKINGFETIYRLISFGLEVSEFVLKDLAVFHAVPLALKLKKPHVFEEKIAPNIKTVPMFDAGNKEMENAMIRRFMKIAQDGKDCAHLVDRVRNAILRCFESGGKAYEGPFGTIIHNDFWTSNTMIRYENSRPVQSKILDFQIVTYGSIGKDIVFFLFSSVEQPILKKYYNRLLQVYFDKFIETLRKLRCDTTLFTYDAFEKEIEEAAMNSEFLHSLIMLKPILTSASGVKEMKEMTPEDITTENVSQRQKEKGWFIIKEFAERNWI